MCNLCRRSHKSRDCGIITKPEIRKSILQKENRCFICMEIGHISRKCSNKMKCFNCKGRHHVAVCTFNKDKKDKKDKQNDQNNENENDTTFRNISINRINSVILQTARANIFSTDEKHSSNARVLFDSGSQLNYITPELHNHLKLKSLGKQKVSIKTFGQTVVEKELEKVKVCIKSHDNNENFYVEAFVSDICFPIEQQNINLAQQQYEPLCKVRLADSNPKNLPLRIDILIRASDYCNFFGQQKIKCLNGPTALQSKLGYVLSGPIPKEKASKATNNNFVSAHVLKIVTEHVNPKSILLLIFIQYLTVKNI